MKPTIIDRIWAADASPTSITDISGVKFNIGFEPEIPSYQALNKIFNILTSGFSYTNRQGIFEWDSLTTYESGNKCLYGGKQWKSKSSNTNVVPIPGDDWTVYDGSEIGEIRMFDANTPSTIDGVVVQAGSAGAWVDNTTMPGWYACVASNASFGVPNLANEFIKATTPGSDGVFAGSKNITFTEAELPVHFHTGTFELTSVGSEHTHTYNRADEFGFISVSSVGTGAATIPDSGLGVGVGPGATGGNRGPRVYSVSTSMGTDQYHTHALSPVALATGTGSAMTLGLEAYSVIFIMKVK